MTIENSFPNFHSGISGLVLPVPKYKFPEPFQRSSRLTYYASIFNSIEINRSFYVLPKGKTLARWAREVPGNFKFTFKLWKQITHAKGLQFQEPDVKEFLHAINSVGEKKGCLLIQFPASFRNENSLQLEHLLHTIQTYNPDNAWNVTIEFRDSSWYDEDTYDLVKTYGASVVMHDKAKVSSPHLHQGFDLAYLRFHGPRGDYRGSYSDDFLDEYARYIREWLTEGKSVYVYFNNTMGSACENLRKLNDYVIATG